MANLSRSAISPDRVKRVATRLGTNAALGLPFFLIGVFGITAADLSDLSLIFLAIVILGAAIVLIGFYGSVLARPNPNLMPDEQIHELRHPSMKPAMARIAMSVPFFLAPVTWWPSPTCPTSTPSPSSSSDCSST